MDTQLENNSTETIIPTQSTRTYKARIASSPSYKLIAIAIIILLLMIPMSLITDVIEERQGRQQEAENEIGKTWGGEQHISGPVLTVPYKYHIGDNGRFRIEHAHFLPEELDISSVIIPQLLNRGIYEVVTYNAEYEMHGSFRYPDFSAWDMVPSDILWDKAFVSFGIANPGTIGDVLSGTWNGIDMSVEPQTLITAYLEQGVHAKIAIPTGEDSPQTLHYTFKTTIQGSKSLSFIPLAAKTVVAVSSPWKDPGFYGSYLPRTREISEEGFSAQWVTRNIGMNLKQKWIGTEVGVFDAAQFGVNLVVPVDTYHKTERSTKYALLFMVLTFITFYLIEIFYSIKLHPIQYLMVGFALSIFYLLLLSLSEYIPFSGAYVIASLAVIATITGYSYAILGTIVRSLIILGVSITLYVFLFSLMLAAEYSLIMGSFGLFVLLALLMYLTRKINWYKLSSDTSTT
ncbi:MAG: cell envelope integrity protein CreD [Fibrobacterales bacterium]